MYKISFLILFFSSIFTFAQNNNCNSIFWKSAQTLKDEKFRLERSNSKIKQSTFSTAEYKNNKPSKKTGINSINEYNKEGFLVKEIQYNKEDTTITSHKYNNNNDIVLTVNENPDSSLINKFEYIFENCFNYKIIEYKANGNVNNTYYQYYKEGALIKRRQFNMNNNLEKTTLFSNDSANRIILEEYFDKDSLFQGKIAYKYDKYNLIEKINFDKKNRIESKTVYKFDSTNNEIEALILNENGSLKEKTIKEYYDNGKVKSITKYNSTNQIEHIYKYFLNAEGLIDKAQTFYIADKPTYEHYYKYEYF